MIKSDFTNLLNSVAQQQQRKHSTSPKPVMKLQQPGGAFQPQVSNKPTLITPAMFQVSHVEEKVVAPTPLTQNQLFQALNFMLETDPDFIRKVHSSYLKIFSLKKN